MKFLAPGRILKLGRIIGFAAFFLLGGFAAISAPAPPSVAIAVDGKPVSAKDGRIEISPFARQVVFRLDGTPAKPASDFYRVRHKLEGVDSDWVQPSGMDSLTVCFYDHAGVRFRQQMYEVRGISTGWNDQIERASFVPRHETLTVPDRAEKLGIIISSTGSPASIGVYVVKDLTIVRQSPDLDRRMIFDGCPGDLSGKGAAPGMPHWIADGTDPAMARKFPLGAKTVLGIIDDDVAGHAEWRSAQENAPRVVPGERLTVEWSEIYNNAVGEHAVAYNRLPPGRYDLKVQDVDVWGRPGAEASLAFTVAAPYWKKPWFWGGCLGAANILLLLVGRYLVRAKVRRHIVRTRLLDQERLRIAQDLHDDLGSYLTHISLLSSHAASQASAAESRASFQEISGMTRHLVAALSEAVWTVNPQNDNLESLIGFLCRTITAQCKAAQIRCRIDALAMTDRRQVSSNVRHHIMLALKEAVNNALKHSGTGELHARISFQPPVLHITISDEGRGFLPAQLQEGNGLLNMKQRMAAVGGTFSMKNRPGGGTEARFEIPLP